MESVIRIDDDDKDIQKVDVDDQTRELGRALASLAIL